MDKIIAVSVACCNEDAKCKACVPDWGKKFYIECDKEKPEEDQFTVYFPLMGFDDEIRAKVKYFKPLVTSEGIWYLNHRDVLKIYKKTDIERGITNKILALVDYYKHREKVENEERK